MFSRVRRSKTENDILSRHTRLHKLDRYAGGRAIVLNPDFSVDDVDVNYHAMHATAPLPTYTNEFIVVVLIVKNQFRPDIPHGGLIVRVDVQQLADDLSIFGYPIHCTTLSFSS
jgi:hypothetical protein